jgi:hypothetical protein
MPSPGVRVVYGSVSTVNSIGRDHAARQGPTDPQISPNISEPSKQSLLTDKSGPTTNEPALITSRWVSDWKDP